MLNLPQIFLSLFIAVNTVAAHAIEVDDIIISFSRLTLPLPSPPRPNTFSPRARYYNLTKKLLAKAGTSFHPQHSDYLYRYFPRERFLAKASTNDLITLHEFARAQHDQASSDVGEFDPLESINYRRADQLAAVIYLLHYSYVTLLGPLYKNSYDQRYLSEFISWDMPRNEQRRLLNLAGLSSGSEKARLVIEWLTQKLRLEVLEVSAKITKAVDQLAAGDSSKAEFDEVMDAESALRLKFNRLRDEMLFASRRANEIRRRHLNDFSLLRAEVAKLGAELKTSLHTPGPDRYQELRNELILRYVLTAGATMSSVGTSHPPGADDGLWNAFFDQAEIDLTAMSNCVVLLTLTSELPAGG